MEVSIEIDEFTNCLVDSKTKEEYETCISLHSKAILKREAKKFQKNGWLFDWSIPQKNGYNVYDLTLKNDKEIQGMIALKPIKEDFAIKIDIVESAPHNRIDKRYRGVGPHLFAFACKVSFEEGFGGYVMFDAKTKLVKYYERKLKAQRITGNRMYIDTVSARKLIKRYFKKGEVA